MATIREESEAGKEVRKRERKHTKVYNPSQTQSQTRVSKQREEKSKEKQRFKSELESSEFILLASEASMQLTASHKAFLRDLHGLFPLVTLFLWCLGWRLSLHNPQLMTLSPILKPWPSIQEVTIFQLEAAMNQQPYQPHLNMASR